MTRGRWLLAPVAAGASLLAAASLYRSYAADLRDAYARLDAADRSTVDTTFGSVEYAVEGDGPPILVAHGIVGGFDQALQTGRNLLDGDATVLGASRFGYLGSTLPEDPSPANQARAYAAVLDHLGIDDAVILGVSAGGAPAIRFALDYPERTRGLVLVGSTAPTDRPIEGATGPPAAALRDPVFWLLTERTRVVLLKLFGVALGEYVRASPAEQQTVRDLFGTLLPVEPRRPGVEVDTRVTNRAMADSYGAYDLESMSVPALVLHAENDPLASYADARRAAERIPDADFRGFSDGGHLLFGHGEAVREAISAFVADPGRQSVPA